MAELNRVTMAARTCVRCGSKFYTCDDERVICFECKYKRRVKMWKMIGVLLAFGIGFMIGTIFA